MRNSTAVSLMTPLQAEVKYILLILLAALRERLSYSEAEMLSEASGSLEDPQ